MAPVRLTTAWISVPQPAIQPQTRNVCGDDWLGCENCARRAQAAGVWAGTSRASRPGMGFTKILCPVDFSSGSREALRVAIEITRASPASLVLAYVSNPLQWSRSNIFQIAPNALQDALDAEQAELARWLLLAKDLGAREVAVRFLTGTPWDQIVQFARADRTIDLVVMGTHGRTGLAHVLLGSVAEKVVRHAPCAVLVVRPPEVSA